MVYIIWLLWQCPNTPFKKSTDKKFDPMMLVSLLYNPINEQKQKRLFFNQPKNSSKNTFYTTVYQSYKDNRIGIFKYHYRYISPLLELFKLFFVYISEFLEERNMSNVIFRIKQQIRSSALNIWTDKFSIFIFLRNSAMLIRNSEKGKSNGTYNLK